MTRPPRTRILSLASFALLLTVCSAAGANNWPSLRGPEGTGTVPGANPPIEWSEEKNVLWKVELEGAGHASPAVWGERVYVLSAVNKEGAAPPPSPPAEGERPPRVTPTQVHQFVVSAHDLGSGEVAWRTVVQEEVPHESLHPTASQASASPVTDGEYVWAFFGSRGLYCLNMEGKVLWSADFGTQSTRNEFGEGSTPMVHGDRIVVNWDHEGESFIVALNKKTGEEIWRNARDEPTSWSTPLVVRDGELDVVVVSAANRVRAYDLASGEELWQVGGLGLNVIPTPVADGETVWVMSGWREAHGMAIRYPGARGDLTGTERVLWQTDRGLSYVPSSVLVDGRIYFFQRFSGILSCHVLATGEACYDQLRIESFENIYASPVAAGNRIYSVSRDGTAVVFRAGAEFEELGRNKLDDVFNATPAIVGDKLVLRGDRYLYAIGVSR
jgi:outer membrane protein assembly factor BamB